MQNTLLRSSIVENNKEPGTLPQSSDFALLQERVDSGAIAVPLSLSVHIHRSRVPLRGDHGYL